MSSIDDLEPAGVHDANPDAINGHPVSVADRTISPEFPRFSKLLRGIGKEAVKDAIDRANETIGLFKEKHLVRIRSDRVTLEDYERGTSPEHMELAKNYMDELKELLGEDGETTYVNATMTGGGVAMLRPALLHAYSLHGVDNVNWAIEPQPEEGEPDVYLVTKKMHNLAQGIPGVEALTDEEIAVYENWIHNRVWPELKEQLTKSKVVVIDDQQPLGLAPLIRKHNPDVKIIYRNHIHYDQALAADPSTPSGQLFEYWRQSGAIGALDAAISHIGPEGKPFRFPEVPESPVHYNMPATIEPHDDLNRPLTNHEVNENYEWVNRQIAEQNKELGEEDQQPSIDQHRARIMTIARFDESKNPVATMRLHAEVCKKLLAEAEAEGRPAPELPQCVIAGNRADDDPSADKMYKAALELRRQMPKEIRDAIVVALLPHNYEAVNAMMTGTEVPNSIHHVPYFYVQPSIREGCETRLTDAKDHGLPIYTQDGTGTYTQFDEHEQHRIIDFEHPDELSRIAEEIVNAIRSPDRYSEMRQETLRSARSYNHVNFTTMSNLIRMGRAITDVLKGKHRTRDAASRDLWKIDDILRDQLAAEAA